MCRRHFQGLREALLSSCLPPAPFPSAPIFSLLAKKEEATRVAPLPRNEHRNAA
jgi:hypothetical protein